MDENNYEYQDTRKWLFHDDKFGIGKTTIDLNFAMKNGLQPVIISPWEDNYDEDLLQLIYHKTSKSNRSNWYAGVKSAYIFLVVTIAGLLIFFNNTFIINLFDIGFNYAKKYILPFVNITIDYFKFIPLYYVELRSILFLILSIILAFAFLPKIILFRRDNTKYYQDFYIKKIQSMFKHNNKLFIIEDVDRLNKDVFNNIFRILSLLNQQLYNTQIIGLISLDSKIVSKNYENVFETIENKIIYKKIFNDYNYEKSIEKYLNDGIEFLAILDKRNIKFVSIKKIIKKEKIKNFWRCSYLFRRLYKRISDPPTVTDKSILKPC